MNKYFLIEVVPNLKYNLHSFYVAAVVQCKGHFDRSKMVELWSGVAQYCLLVGNYNSATVILEALESAPIARLQVTVIIYSFPKNIF